MSKNLGLKLIRPICRISQILGAFPAMNFKNYHLNISIYQLCYSIFVYLIYAIIYGMSIWKRIKDTYSFTPNITDTILDFASYTSMTITSLVFIQNNCFIFHAEIQELLWKFSKVDQTLLKSDFQYKNINQKHKKWLRKHLFIFGILLIFGCLYSEIFWTVTLSYKENWGYSGAVLLKTNLFTTSIIIYNILLALKYRFSYLNTLLKNGDSFKVNYVKDIYVINNRKGFDMRLINELHKELLIMCADCNKIFGAPVLFLSLSFVVSILHPINSALLQVMKGNVFDGVDIPNFGLHYVIMSLLSAINSMILVVPIAHAGYSVVKESTLIIQLSENLAKKLSLFEYNPKFGLIIEDLRSWSREMNHKYPIFTASSFFRVDHSMLLTVFGSVSSYLIVLIQINMFEETNTVVNTTLVDIVD